MITLQELRDRWEKERYEYRELVTRDLIEGLFAYIECEKKSAPAIPDGYEVAEDPEKTCSHAMLPNGEVVEADAGNTVMIHLPRSGTVYLSYEDLPRLGITLLREKKPEPRVWEGELVCADARRMAQNSSEWYVGWDMGAPEGSQEVLPE